MDRPDVPSPWIDQIRQVPILRRRRGNGPGQVAAAVVFVAGALYSAVYTVQPTELAFTRTFGRVDQTPANPVGPGVHLRWPLITDVDRIQVSTDTISPPDDLRVLSHDGQVIMLGVSITRRIPPDAVYNLLYNTGGVGNVDIDRNIFAILADRTLTVFGREDVLNIAQDRERIIGIMKTVIAQDLRRLFGIELIDLQITGFRFSPEYEQAVNQNTLAKTNAYRAEQVLKQKQIEAQQAAAEAKGLADAAIENARGQSQSTLLNAAAAGASGRLVSISSRGAPTSLCVHAQPRMVAKSVISTASTEPPAGM